jgi:hypothetical protein
MAYNDNYMGKYFAPHSKSEEGWANNLVIQVVHVGPNDDFTIKIIEHENKESIGLTEQMDLYEIDDLEMITSYEAIKQFDSDLEELLNAKE